MEESDGKLAFKISGIKDVSVRNKIAHEISSFLRSYSGKVMHTVFKVRSVLCSYTIPKFTEEI